MRTQAFDFSVDLMRAVLWQYDGAPRLQLLLQRKLEWYERNQTAFWEDWFRDVFDLRTANDFGLSVWAILLGLPLYSPIIPSPPDYPAFGFGAFGLNFTQGNFATEPSGLSGLSLDEKRLLLRLRYFQLTTRGAVPEINAFLTSLFGPGKVYVLDNLNMTMRYVFLTPPSPNLLRAFATLDILPRPAAVSLTIGDATDTADFGFAPFGQPFNQGNFWKATT